MILSLTFKKNEKNVFIKLGETVTEEQGLMFLQALDFEELYDASLCQDNGIIIHRIKGK